MGHTEKLDAEHAGHSPSDHDPDQELLRFITCGSVDDGKSTLIGRLLLESGAVFDDQIEALIRDSKKHGTTKGELDTALLVDGLEDERRQGITIDVAYRYFSTARRKFIIADTPGHEQYTRNMATGASNASLALVLVDARKGVLTQTKRHAFIVSLLGIKHVILVVNKMDLVGYSQAVFQQICQEFTRFASQLDIPDVRFVPVSALLGDNVAEPSSNMLWHDDGSLLHMLDHVYVGRDDNSRDLRLPVQWVNRPNEAFRGFSGMIVSGTLRVGDKVMVLPSQRTSRVDGIVTLEGELTKASSRESVTVTLEDEIDITRGDMIVSEDNPPFVRRKAEAMLVWMSENQLSTGKQYWVKHNSHRTSAEVHSIEYTLDINTLDRKIPAPLKLNEIGCCRLVFHDPLVFDSYQRNRHTGSFILVDRVTHETVAAGMLLAPRSDITEQDCWDARVEERLRPTLSQIGMDRRAATYGHQPFTVLITGLSGAGKSTLALELEERLFDSGRKCVLIDGQNLRMGISRDLGFSAAERSENLRRAAEICRMLNASGLIGIAAFVAPHADVRNRVVATIGPDRLFHVHLLTPLDVCRQRDRSGRYQAAERGEIADFPGVTCRYEQPDDADLYVDLTEQSAKAALQPIIDAINGKEVDIKAELHIAVASRNMLTGS